MADMVLDQLVAKAVMGWRAGSDGRFIGPGRAWRPAHAFQPSSSIDAAWKVVERMAERGLMLSLQRVQGGTTRAIFSERLPGDCKRDEQCCGTTQLAICFAALDAVEPSWASRPEAERNA